MAWASNSNIDIATLLEGYTRRLRNLRSDLVTHSEAMRLSKVRRDQEIYDLVEGSLSSFSVDLERLQASPRWGPFFTKFPGFVNYFFDYHDYKPVWYKRLCFIDDREEVFAHKLEFMKQSAKNWLIGTKDFFRPLPEEIRVRNDLQDRINKLERLIQKYMHLQVVVASGVPLTSTQRSQLQAVSTRTTFDDDSIDDDTIESLAKLLSQVRTVIPQPSDPSPSAVASSPMIDLSDTGGGDFTGGGATETFNVVDPDPVIDSTSSDDSSGSDDD